MLIAVFWSTPTACSNGSRLMFSSQGEVEGNERQDAARRSGRDMVKYIFQFL